MLAPEIANRRADRGLTQRGLARLIGVTVGCIAHFEKCEYKDRHYIPDNDKLHKLVSVLYPDSEEREMALARWQYLAMVDRAQVEYPGFLDRIKQARKRAPSRLPLDVPL